MKKEWTINPEVIELDVSMTKNSPGATSGADSFFGGQDGAITQGSANLLNGDTDFS